MSERQYEAMYIVKPNLAEEDVKRITERFRTVVEENGGAVSEAGVWEKRRLAYPISGFKDGTYILMKFSSGPSVPQELGRLLRINDDVLRHRVFKVES